ncbi:MAG: polysaccharide deacetylase family protein [Lachnospiraceae bacterium]|nr:polysaccharide deacetylase family protein [Lachnospiraceae bacterium]
MNTKKRIRTVLEAIILIALFLFVIKKLFTFTTYQPYNEEEIDLQTSDSGFIAISYFGVAREGTETLISEEVLDAQLQALYDSGYVTISQQDIWDYYNKGKKLPEKSLFLMFEDGRRDTVVFAEKVTEKYNYLSTIMTYANKLEQKDSAFIQPKDMRSLEKNGYWEFGTNGYRLSYINVYNKDNQYLGKLTAEEYQELQGSLGRDYNHYLMDYIRDENRIPMESYAQMKDRIDGDYNKMEEIYTDKVGNVPDLYVLMHANTGRFGENERVSSINESNIKRMFSMNFNRESYAVNNLSNSIYDLTRVQPQAYWHTNHLLMRIKDDTNLPVKWVDGDVKKKADWEQIDGISEFSGDEIYLTCESKATGTLRLKGSEHFKDVTVATELQGNALGKQGIYLRADKDLTDYLFVAIENEELVIRTSGNKVLYTEPLAEKTADTELELKDASNHKLVVSLKGNQLTVIIDEVTKVENLEVPVKEKGCVYLQSGWGGEAYSQRNLADDVYDGVFKKVKVTQATGAGEETVLYDNMLHGTEKVFADVRRFWNNLVNLFVETF